MQSSLFSLQTKDQRGAEFSVMSPLSLDETSDTGADDAGRGLWERGPNSEYAELTKNDT